MSTHVDSGFEPVEDFDLSPYAVHFAKRYVIDLETGLGNYEAGS